MSKLLGILTPPPSSSAAPLVWTKIEVGTGDGFTIDPAMLVTPNTTVGKYISTSSVTATAHANASGGSYRFGNSNNRSLQIVVDNVVGFRWYGFIASDTAPTLMDMFVDYDGNIANRHGQITIDGPVDPPALQYEVTGLPRGKHAFMIRENGAGFFGCDYFMYQS